MRSPCSIRVTTTDGCKVQWLNPEEHPNETPPGCSKEADEARRRAAEADWKRQDEVKRVREEREKIERQIEQARRGQAEAERRYRERWEEWERREYEIRCNPRRTYVNQYRTDGCDNGPRR